jgi:hypothetical protein
MGRCIAYHSVMSPCPIDVLSRLRSPAKALCDLVERYERLPCNDPDRVDVARMIRQLAFELTRAAAVDYDLDWAR